METEYNGMLPFLGIQLLNRSHQIETRVYVKLTNSSPLLHYQSHVENRYKQGLLRTMLDRAYRLSSCWSHFSDECDWLKTAFSRLKYPKHLVNSTIKSFVDSKVCDQQQPLSPVGCTRGHLHNRVKGHNQQSSAIPPLQTITRTCTGRSDQRQFSLNIDKCNYTSVLQERHFPSGNSL